MSVSKSFEVYVYKAGNWNIDSVYDDRQMAIYEAQKLLELRGKTAVGAVRVIEEVLDPDSGETRSKVVFRALKKPKEGPKETAKGTPSGNKAKTKAKSSTDDLPLSSKKAKATSPEDVEAKLVRYVVMLVLSVGGIALVLIAGMALLIHYLRP